VSLDTNGIDSVFTICMWKSNKINSLIEKFIKFKVNKDDKVLDED